MNRVTQAQVCWLAPAAGLNRGCDEPGQWDVGVASVAGSTRSPERMSSWIGSVTSQMLTFIPASTRRSCSQNAMNSRACEVAADHDLVVAVGLGVAGVLHAEVVLVGEEVRQPVVGGGSAEHGLGGDGRLVQRVGPVLDAELPAQQRVVGVGDVTGGEDVRVGGAQVLVDQDAVVDVEPGRIGASSTFGVTPMPTTTTSAASSVPSASSTAPAGRRVGAGGPDRRRR